MGNISTKVNLGALKNAVIIMSGKNKDVECLLIPIAQNHLYKNDKGVVSLELIGFEIAPEKRKADSKDTHLVKQSLSKEILEKLSEEEKKAFPILGNHVNWDESGSGGNNASAPVVAASEDDLPF